MIKLETLIKKLKTIIVKLDYTKSKETLYVKNNIISANYIDFQNITIYSFSENNSFNSNNVSKKYLSKK